MRQWIHRLFGLALAISQLGCQKQTNFNPAFAGRFFPLRSGFSWIYKVAYANGARETIAERVAGPDQIRKAGAGLLVISDYSAVDGGRAVWTDLPQTYPSETTEVETRYIVEAGFITRVQTLGKVSWIRLEERRFLPQYLWPERTWSNTLSPFQDLSEGILTVKQKHRTFLEEQDVVVPGGRFADCIRVETEASYQNPAESSDQRFFEDWYAPDVGLVKTIVLNGSIDGPEIARIELLSFAKSKNRSRGRLFDRRPDNSSVVRRKPVIVDPLTHR
jgi:hypothetical protein